MAESFRILSLSGGGIRGVYSTSVLAHLEQLTGKTAFEHFDLIVGASTGGMLALGLAMGHSATKILDFYRDDGPRVFPSGPLERQYRKLRQVVVPKYTGKPLELALRNFFGDELCMGDAKTRVVIPAYDVSEGRPVCFKSCHHPSLIRASEFPVWEVAMATTAAPTFFPAFEASWGGRYVDGGVWANRPSLVGVLEATRFLGVEPNQIELLNIGTTKSRHRVKKLRLGGWLPLAKGVFEVLLSASEDASHFATDLATHEGYATNIDWTQCTRSFRIDDGRPETIDALIALGAQSAEQAARRIGGRFFTDPRPSFRAAI